MAAISGEGKIFLKTAIRYSLDTPWIEYFVKITLSRTVQVIQAILCFSIFGKNLKIQNGRHFWGGENFLKIANRHSLDTLWVENFVEITLSRTVKEIHAFLFFQR